MLLSRFGSAWICVSVCFFFVCLCKVFFLFVSRPSVVLNHFEVTVHFWSSEKNCSAPESTFERARCRKIYDKYALTLLSLFPLSHQHRDPSYSNFSKKLHYYKELGWIITPPPPPPISRKKFLRLLFSKTVSIFFETGEEGSNQNLSIVIF